MLTEVTEIICALLPQAVIQFHFKPGMTFQNLAGLDANNEFPTDISEL